MKRARSVNKFIKDVQNSCFSHTDKRTGHANYLGHDIKVEKGKYQSWELSVDGKYLVTKTSRTELLIIGMLKAVALGRANA